MIVRTCKCGNVGLPCGICDWQTSNLQPSQGITTQILSCLFGMAILYMRNAFQTYVYCFRRTSVEIVQFKKVKPSLKTPRDTQQSFPEP
jgi:hypothetical protein